MNPKKRTDQIDRLAKAIRLIAADFEKFGGKFLEALLEVPMTQQGVNLLGYPVKGVVDTVSEDGLIAAEYSAQKGYFDGEMAKADEDLKKALDRRPTAKHIFLLASEKRRPEIAQKFEKDVRDRREMKGKTLHLWGCEEIATKLVEELLISDRAVRRLSEYLPELQRIRGEEEVSRLAPAPDDRRLLRPDVDAELVGRLAQSPCVVISGLGGIGKSAAAQAFAADHEDDYDLAIWVDRDELRRKEDLQALVLGRGGETRNVATLMRSLACLLILDDAIEDLDPVTLAAMCGPTSHVIMTRRKASSGSYALPEFDPEQAGEILNRDVPTACPDDVLKIIREAVGGHPLSLGLLNAAVREGATWAEVAADCAAVGHLEDRGQLLAHRLLERLRPAMTAELSVFDWAGQASCSQDFLEEVVKPMGLRKLKDYGVTAADRPATVRLHELVFRSLAVSTWCDTDRARRLEEILEAYLIAASQETGLRHWTVSSELLPKIEQLVAGGDARPAFVYALLATWPPEDLKSELVGEPLETVARLKDKPPPAMAVITVIEAIEQLFLHDKHLDRINGTRTASRNLKARLPVFEQLAELPGLSQREQAQIEHHKGKALKRLGDRAGAAALFEAVLKGPDPMNESRLQLIDLYRADPAKVEQAVAHAEEILGRAAGHDDVTYSVFLGAVERLPWGSGAWRADLMRRHASAIRSTIVEAAKVGVPQAVKAFAGLGRYLSKEDPELFASIFAELPQPVLAALRTDDERAAWAEVYFEASRLGGVDSDKVMRLALDFYESEVDPEDFHRQRRAELLIEMGRAAEAESILDGLRDTEWIQRLRARARFQLGDPKGAREAIDRALEKLKAGSPFESEFLELRFEIREALGDVDAVDDLKAAHARSQKDAERARLNKRLARLDD